MNTRRQFRNEYLRMYINVNTRQQIYINWAIFFFRQSLQHMNASVKTSCGTEDHYPDIFTRSTTHVIYL